ncbi:MAG: hypothetical protein QF807_02765 [Candidatus Thalassarchaeaceae archaeon]|nr:hypothetical protein [Candidatus Thalassarchaeaceae archaeon]
MNECIICQESLGADDFSWCEMCARFAPLLVGSGFEARPNIVERQEINELLANDRGRTSMRRWRTILETFQSDETDWAFNAEDEIGTDDSDPWFISEEQRLAQLDKLHPILCGRNTNDIDISPYCQRGIPLPDGSILSMIDGIWAIDGHILPGAAPYNHIMRALTSNRNEQNKMAGCDWVKLLTTLIMASNNGENYRGRRRNNPRNAQRWARNFMRRRYGRRPPVFAGANLFLNWVNNWADQIEGNPPNDVHLDFQGERIQCIAGYKNLPLNLNAPEFQGLPWANRWRNVIETGNQIALMHEWAGPLLRINNGRVQLRTIRDGKWIWSQIPPWPRLWALLSNWALSPATSKEHQRLRAIQWCWHEAVSELMPDEPERRALSLLREICDESDQLTIPQEGKARIYVEGTSGMFYEVGPGPGAHDARFTVKGATSIENLGKNRSEPLCIHEDGNFKNLPVGDVIASVVLTLIDDLTSAKKLEPLSNFIRHNKISQQMENNNRVHPNWLQFQRERFYRRGGNARRWLDTFPAIYRVLVNLPVGSILRVPIVVPNPAVIDNTEVMWVIQDQDEEELVNSLAQLAGFRAQPDEVDDYVLWERVDVPVNGVRRELVEMLGPYERRHGRPGEPPWWNLFPNPIGPNQLLPRLPAELDRPLGDGIV